MYVILWNENWKWRRLNLPLDHVLPSSGYLGKLIVLKYRFHAREFIDHIRAELWWNLLASLGSCVFFINVCFPRFWLSFFSVYWEIYIVINVCSLANIYINLLSKTGIIISKNRCLCLWFLSWIRVPVFRNWGNCCGK